MKVRKTLIFPFEQPTPHTSSKLSLLQMAAHWLETAMRTLKNSRPCEGFEEYKDSAEPELPDCIQERSLRNCSFRPRHEPIRFFHPTRSRLTLSRSAKTDNCGKL